MRLNPVPLSATNLQLLPSSLTEYEGVEYGLARQRDGLYLAALADSKAPQLPTFTGEIENIGQQTLLVGPLNAKNAAALRTALPWLQPRLLGLQTSIGLGDRLGLATPGHIQAVRRAGGSIAPVLAQQSMRELERTKRSPQQVLDDATWGAFQENWRGGFGADADHLKTTADIDACLAAGFTFFTIDPGAFVDDLAETAGLSELRERASQLPNELQPVASRLLNQTLSIEHLTLHFDEATLLRAAVKYAAAVGHVAAMVHHLVAAAGTRAFEVEISVDETAYPTSHCEHAYIAHELNRLGVNWTSLAPRFVGEFEKGVDYIGDLAAFETDLAGHAAIARHFGPYKLSLHSGSDKFSIYPAIVRQTGGLAHLKTAGTSYLEALHTIATQDANLIAEIYAFARDRYETDRASYHVSARLDRAPQPEAVLDWSALLDQFDAREILHVTFGSVLTERNPDGDLRFANRLMCTLRAHPDAYAVNLDRHFTRHLKPFTLQTQQPDRRSP